MTWARAFLNGATNSTELSVHQLDYAVFMGMEQFIDVCAPTLCELVRRTRVAGNGTLMLSAFTIDTVENWQEDEPCDVTLSTLHSFNLVRQACGLAHTTLEAMLLDTGATEATLQHWVRHATGSVDVTYTAAHAAAA